MYIHDSSDSTDQFAYLSRCCMCGIALTVNEVYARICDAKFTEFTTRQDGLVTVNFCSECWCRMMQFLDEPFEKAVERRVALEKLR